MEEAVVNEAVGKTLEERPIMQKEWAARLFSMDLMEASTQLGAAMDEALKDNMTPIDRFRLAEVARVLVMGVHNRWARIYTSNASACDEDVLLWQMLWGFYSSNLRALHAGDADLIEHKTTFLQRALFIGKELRLIHALARKPFPEKFWKEIYAYFRFAERLDCLDVTIPDKLSSFDNRVNCYSTAVHAMLLDLANTDTLSEQQILWVNRWLPRMARKVSPVVPRVPMTGLFLEIDLEMGQGAMLRAQILPSGELIRFASMEGIAQTLHRRRRHLIAGEEPARLKLGSDITRDQAIELLVHLEAAWCPPDLSRAVGPDTNAFKWDESVD